MDLHNSTATAPQPIYSPTPVPVEQFIDGIREMSAGLITKQKIYDFLATYEIRSEDLERYKMWLPDRHTRNKVFRNEMIEAMLICWPIGARMSVPFSASGARLSSFTTSFFRCHRVHPRRKCWRLCASSP